LTRRYFDHMIESDVSISRMTDTREKILDAAERLFADQGYAVTSLRQIIAAAKVNIAAVHYHFGAKEDLLDAVILRKVAPVNAARMAWLDRIEAEAGTGPLRIEDVLESFLLPTAATSQQNPAFVRLMGRMLTEGMMPSLVQKHFQATVMRFSSALRRAVPDLPQQELMWRVHFMIGATAHAMSMKPILSGMEGDVPDMTFRMRRLVTFLAAGFRAPGNPAVSESKEN
jgi:AcrR family transcriptional regulator